VDYDVGTAVKVLESLRLIQTRDARDSHIHKWSTKNVYMQHERIIVVQLEMLNTQVNSVASNAGIINY